ncbi:hypothetical protein EB796_024127 [Bugula neritina]|uniref:LolA-like domain-containing protein n=1 Tax=Bugula neritina TaxID=10212 RepID=A0A7J7IVI6_BUGNE|nr:hypothetical protein EB796_024127 [Bugula neritina]
MKCQILLLVVGACLVSDILAAGINKNVCEPGQEKPGEREAAGKYKNISLIGWDIYNFYSNQIVEILHLPDDTYYCNASQLDGRGVDTFVFGDDVNSQSGFTSKSAFLINPAYPPVYKGKEVLDFGIKVEKWWDCHYIPALDATVTAEWYFTDSDDWTPASGANNPTPVMLKVKGRLGDIRDIDHTYTFNSFKPLISTTEAKYFQVPAGTACPHLKNFDIGQPQPHDIPPLAQNGFFSFEAEFIQQVAKDTGLFTTIKEYYDSTLNLSNYIYTPKGTLLGYNTPGAQRPISEVHDFLTGVAYVMDTELGNCTVKPLSQSGNFDVISTTDANHVRMKTVKEFFGFGTKAAGMNWTYTGQRKIRDITADVYVSQRSGFPDGSPDNVTSTWEIAFTSPAYFDVASGTGELEVMEPLRLWITVPSLGYTLTYNIFDFNEDEPNPWVFDVANCFRDDQKSNVHFYIEGDQAERIETHREEFHYWLLISVIGYLGISPIRVNNINILDPPTIQGSTIDRLPATYLVSTSDALAALDKAITSSDFIIETGSIVETGTIGDGTLKPVRAIPNSIVHYVNNTVVHHIDNTKASTGNSQSDHMINEKVCKPGSEKPDPIAKDFPPIPNIFATEIEMYVAQNKTTRSLFEIFDSPRDRAVIGERDVTGKYKNISLIGWDIYNFHSNQIVEIFDLPDDTFYCNAAQLDGRGVDTFVFGDDVNSQSGFTSKSAFFNKSSLSTSL